MLERFQALITEYGKIALVVHFVIYGLAIAGFSLAIRLGFDVGGAAETTGTVFAGWAVAKAIQPLRIALTLVLTPVIARLIHRGDGPAPGSGGAGAATDEGDTPSMGGGPRPKGGRGAARSRDGGALGGVVAPMDPLDGLPPAPPSGVL